MLGKRKGQSTLEYALIILVVVAAFVALNKYIRRSVQGRLRATSDQIGNQFDVATGNTTWANLGGEKEADAELVTTIRETRPVNEEGETDETGAIFSNITAAEIIERQENDTWQGGS